MHACEVELTPSLYGLAGAWVALAEPLHTLQGRAAL